MTCALNYYDGYRTARYTPTQRYKHFLLCVGYQPIFCKLSAIILVLTLFNGWMMIVESFITLTGPDMVVALLQQHITFNLNYPDDIVT